MASYKQHVSVSELIKKGKEDKDKDEVLNKKRTKGEYRKEKDIEEDRKAGIAPAMVDVDTGRDINPHIPQFITQTPWYVTTDGPTLKHQRPHPERQKVYSAVDDWYARGDTGKKATKYRKGACENCGAMTHKKKDCFERPRKLGARFTNEDIAADEFIQPKLALGFEAKRDRWNGYDPESQKEVIAEFERAEEVRKLVRAQKLREEAELRAALEGEEGTSEATVPTEEDLKRAEEDEDKYAEDADMAGVTVDMDSRTRITVRNLRIREDTAKYLYNLDENAPYYDPKSRSMRENPLAGVEGKEDAAVHFQGENFIRYTGEVVDANKAQVFAWQARMSGLDIHAQAAPTRLEALQREFEKEKSSAGQEQKKALLAKYGGEEYLVKEEREKELLLGQSEGYVEYSASGRVVKGVERKAIKSRYEEDVYPGNHTSVWGSWWHEGKWGYKCCHSTFYNSYCIGEKGYEVGQEFTGGAKNKPQEGSNDDEKEEQEEEENEKKKEKDNSSSSESELSGEEEEEEEEDDEVAEEERRKEEAENEKIKRERDQVRRDKKREKRKRRKLKMGGKKKRKTRESSTESESSGSSESSSESEKEEETKEDKDRKEKKKQKELLKAIKKLEKQRREAQQEAQGAYGDRKRKYNTTYEVKAPTAAEVEAFNLTRIHSADPMANYMNEKRSKHLISKRLKTQMWESVVETFFHLDETLSERLVVAPTWRVYGLVLEWFVHGVPWLVVSSLLLVSSYAAKWDEKTQRTLLILNIGLILDLAVVGLTKVSVQRARPRNNVDDQIYEAPIADKFSFPSGHSSRASMLLTLSQSLCPSLFTAFFWFPYVLAYSRVAMGRHFLSDAIAGLLLGWTEGRLTLLTPPWLNTLFQKIFH